MLDGICDICLLFSLSFFSFSVLLFYVVDANDVKKDVYLHYWYLYSYVCLFIYLFTTLILGFCARLC